MPTKHCSVRALCIETALIVVGGIAGDGVMLRAVEILNTSCRQWHTATELLEPLAASSITVCGNRVCLLGGTGDSGESVYSCSLTKLIMSRRCSIARDLSRFSANDS